MHACPRCGTRHPHRCDCTSFDRIDDVFEDLDAFSQDTDELISALQLPGYVRTPPLRPVPPRFRNIGYGEITTTHPSKAREGLANLNQDMVYPHLRGIPSGVRGRPALVQYDRQGNVIMRVLSPDQQQVAWQGTIGRIAMPSGGRPGQRNQLIEDRVRRLVAARTGRRFQRHQVAGRGADLVAVPRTRRRPAR